MGVQDGEVSARCSAFGLRSTLQPPDNIENATKSRHSTFHFLSVVFSWIFLTPIFRFEHPEVHCCKTPYLSIQYLTSKMTSKNISQTPIFTMLPSLSTRHRFAPYSKRIPLYNQLNCLNYVAKSMPDSSVALCMLNRRHSDSEILSERSSCSDSPAQSGLSQESEPVLDICKLYSLDADDSTLVEQIAQVGLMIYI